MKITDTQIFQARLLIVDDQEANVVLLEQALLDAGYTNISLCMNPLEVCALHRKHAFDLILLDLQMPRMDGFAVMEALKANQQDPYLPVLVVTAQPGHKLRALQAGARDFVSKPFDLLEVKTRVRNTLEVQMLYKKLKDSNCALDNTVEQRTAELRASEARYRGLAELASDWYWEQDSQNNFVRISGPVLEMLGIRVDALDGTQAEDSDDGWDATQRAALRERIAQHQPFLDFLLSRINTDGSRQQFRVSGEPMFNHVASFIGYRGVGVEVLPRRQMAV
ncbi:MAG: response regulator [Rhodoferax sp.]|nr:response regulator [Rhodoferax sp.]